MNQGPVSCLPMNNKMSKVKKALDEAHETRTRELDLVDKNVVSFDEMPGLCKLFCHGQSRNIRNTSIFGSK